MNIMSQQAAAPSAVRVIHRRLCSKQGGRAKIESLEAELRPETALSDDNRLKLLRADNAFGANVLMGEQAGLWAKDGEYLCLAEDARGLTSDALRLKLALAALGPDADPPLARFAAWLLAQPDPLGPTLELGEMERLWSSQGGISAPGKTQREQATQWLGWFGLIAGEKSVRPDPTGLLVLWVPSAFERGMRISIDDFVDTLARAMPVFDTGSVRGSVQASFATLAAPPAGSVSPSLELGLLGASEAEVLALVTESDAAGQTLPMSARRITHVAIGGTP